MLGTAVGNPDQARGCPHPAELLLHRSSSNSVCACLYVCVYVCVTHSRLSSQKSEALLRVIYNQGFFCLLAADGVVASTCLSLNNLRAVRLLDKKSLEQNTRNERAAARNWRFPVARWLSHYSDKINRQLCFYLQWSQTLDRTSSFKWRENGPVGVQ